MHLYFIILLLFDFSCAQKLLLFFIDGFRWDYLSNHNYPGFTKLLKNGVYIKKVKPVFPSDCHPNIYSMFTGLYPRHHGVLGNIVYHSSKKVMFNHTNEVHRRNVHNWVNAEPLWVTARKQNKISFLYHLPICEDTFGPLSPSHCFKYEEKMEIPRFSKSVTEALELLKHDILNMAIVYNDMMDRLTHEYGPESDNLRTILLPMLDQIILRTLEEISDTDIHLAIVSDHGMAKIAPEKQIYLERIIRRDPVELVINQGGFAAIWPQENSFQKVLYRITLASKDGHFRVYTNKNLPLEWNIHDHELTPPILIVADPGYFIDSKELHYPETSDSYKSGWHGYSPDSDTMATSFLATGQLLREGESIETAHITDLYPILAKLAGLKELNHNGSSIPLSLFLKTSNYYATITSCGITIHTFYYPLIVTIVVSALFSHYFFIFT